MEGARKLFEPIGIGHLKLKNRIIMGAMVTNFATKEGFVTDRLIDYHVNIAKGGCALNVTENAHVTLEGKRILYGLGSYDDRLIPGYKRLVDGVHAVGGRISLQIFHGGRECASEITGSQPIAPSSLVSRYRGITKKIEMPREMTEGEIDALIEKFGDAGRRAREGGFDSVEIHAAHGYLVSQFLSPYSNKRTDRYGGDVAGRSTFLVRIIQNIKEKAGADFPVLVKLNAKDHVEGGITPDQAAITARLAVEAGADAIVVSVGLHESRPYMIIPPMSVPDFVNVPHAALIKKGLNVPVGVIGRIIDPVRASKVIEEGKADLVVLARALLSDPEWPRKALEGRFDDIRQCIGCNQGCIDNIHKMKPFTCLQNPMVGREREFEIIRSKEPKRVAVIGGGPAGLETARVAALRGHRVTIYEKEQELGGQIRIGRVPPHRDELGKLTDYLSHQAKKAGVEIELRTEITPSMMNGLDADTIILASGALPFTPRIKGVDFKHVVYAFDVLAGKVSVGKKIVVLGGGLVGVETADFLCEQGKEVIILEMMDQVASDTGSANRVYFEDRFAEKRVEVQLGAKVSEIDEEGLTFQQRGWTKRILGVDTVILATGAVPNDALWIGMADKPNPNVFRVGDCVTPRNAMEAVYEGSKIGREI